MSYDALQLSGSLLVAGCYERFLFGMDTGAYSAPTLKKARTRPHVRVTRSLAAAAEGACVHHARTALTLARSTARRRCSRWRRT
jgi:hypothetical protein